MNALSLCLAIPILAMVLTTSADAAAPAGRYTTTNLTVFDTRTKLTWQRTSPQTTYSWLDGKSYCAGVGPNLGGTGWRLPTVKELQTLLDYSQSTAPLIDVAAFPGTQANVFWASSPTVAAAQASQAFSVNFASGIVGNNSMSKIFNVRCVR